MRRLLADAPTPTSCRWTTTSPVRRRTTSTMPRAIYLVGSTVDIAKIWANSGSDGQSVVFHLGEYSRIVQSFDEVDMTWDFNIHGTKEVVRFAKAHRAKLVYAGSSSKFGNEGQDENLNPYAWTKAKNVEYIRNFSNWYGLDYVITYFYNVYGPGQIREGSYATVIGIFEDQYERGVPLTVVSPGTQTRDFTHIDDIIDGIVICADRGRATDICWVPAGSGRSSRSPSCSARRTCRARTSGGTHARAGRHDQGARARLETEAVPRRRT